MRGKGEFRDVRVVREGQDVEGFVHRAVDVQDPCEVVYNMYGTSEPCVGYEKIACLRSVARIPERMATAKRLMTSSACPPSKCAPKMRSVSSSTMVLKPEYVSPTLRDEYQPEVISLRTRNFKPCLPASISLSPTEARGGIVKTTVGMAR